MMKMLSFILLALFLFFEYCSAQPVAQNSKGVDPINEVTKNGKRIILYEDSYALLVGVCEYECWDDLKSIPGEVGLMESALMKHGFMVEKYLNPTGEKLREIVKEFIDRYGFKKSNRLFIFFSGHGYTRKDGTKGYIVPSDAADPVIDEIKFVQQAIEMDQIMTWARRIESKHALFVFDSCFSGTLFQARTLTPPPHITDLTGKDVRQFITAGSAGETVPAKSKFAPYLIRGLEGEADSDKDGYITGTELGAYLHKKITNMKIHQTPQYGKIRDPRLDRGDFVFIGKKVKGPKITTPVKTSFGSIEGAEIKDNILIAFDKYGNQWRKAFESSILCHLVMDVDDDGKKEILLGFSVEGKEFNLVIAYDSKENKKWEYFLQPRNAYYNESSGKFRVSDLIVFKEKKSKGIAVLFSDVYWYQSVLIILSPAGKKLKELWHPGHLHQIERIKDTLIVRARNNDLRQILPVKNPSQNFSVIFGIKYENIYGQAPPYFGTLKKNVQFEWYCYLSDEQVSFTEMKVLNGTIFLTTACGKRFYLNEKGPLNRFGYTDGYSCKEPLNLIGLELK